MLVNKSVVIYPLFGLLLSAHAARAVLETHLPGAALSALIVLFWLTYWDRNKKYWSHNEVIYIVLGALLLCYALLDTALRSWQPLLSFFELIIMILCLLALSSVRFSEKNFKLSFYPIIIFSVILSFLLITSRDSVFSLGINYLLLSLPLSIGVIYCYVYFIFSKRLMEILFFLTLTIILIFGLLQLQSRFNIIFILTFILLSTIINFISVRMNIRFAMLAFVSIAGVFLYFQFESLVAYNRLMNLVEDASSEPRHQTYGIWAEGFSNFWLTGNGIDSSNIFLYSNYRDAYPHNFLLEFWSDFGLIGFLFAFFLLLWFFWLLITIKIFTASSQIIYFISIFIVFNFMKSFSIYDAHALFAALGLLVSISRNQKEKRRST